jgi:predicted amidophosphoribosyltransferase
MSTTTTARGRTRERHFPRLCGACAAPMARQSDTCWRCGTAWSEEAEPRTTLQVLPGGAQSRNDDVEVALPRAAAAEAR